MSGAQKGYEVVGIDHSLGAVLAARRVAIQVGITPHFVVGDGRFLPFRDEEFDVVFSYSVLQHLSKENARRCLDSMARTLRPGGDSLVQMPNFLGIRSLWNQARRGFREAVEFEVHYWSLPDLRRSFTQRLGPTDFFIDCFFGLGLQASDLGVMTGLARRATIVSEWLKLIARFIPLKLFADSVWVQSKKKPS